MAEVISQRLRNMRFMQRPQEEDLVAAARERTASSDGAAHVGEVSLSLVSLDESLLCDSQVLGRRSFKGFNPAIEELMAEREREDREDKAIARVKKEKEESKETVMAPPPKFVSGSGSRKRPEGGRTPDSRPHKRPKTEQF
eukprot:m51a1_g2130 hypothetical protein (141) ;mRNA; f:1703709-1704281